METSNFIKLNSAMKELREDSLKKIYSNEQVEYPILSIADLEIYSKKNTFFSKLNKAMKKSALDENIFLTNEQAKCIDILSKGNLFVSAPTSFGKTYLAFEYIARNKSVLSNIIFVVPTISLMNELRRKCYDFFGDIYTLITSDAELQQYYLAERKIMIMVPERINTKLFKQYLEGNILDFVIYDEIYKLNSINLNKTNENSRVIIMNYIYSYLISRAKKILLLGPFIKEVSFKRSNLNITKYITNLNLVYNQIIFDDKFNDYFGSLDEKRFVYFDSPKSIRKFINNNIIELNDVNADSNIIKWMEENIHPDWYYINYIKKGIGIHHGKTPIFLRKYIESEYANGCIHTILCTSTLIEGINTPTNSLFIHDKPRGVFELNNLIGRVGRLNINNPREGKIYIKNESIMELYNPEDWIELNILFEDSNIISKNIEDECIYLDKDPDAKTSEKIESLKITLKDEFNIDYSEVIELGIEYRILDRFIKNFYKITTYLKEFDVVKDIKFILLGEDNKYLSGLKSSNYSFHDDDLDNNEYIKIDPVYSLLIATQGMRSVIEKFCFVYPGYTKEDINHFIDTLFQVDEFIKFSLSKIISIFDLFNSKHLFENKKNRAFIQSVNMIKVYGNHSDGYERILEDLGFPVQDIDLITSIISMHENDRNTENKLKNIKKNNSFEKLSPFGKKLINEIK